MPIVTPGFHGRPRGAKKELPPGQYLVHDFPVLSAGPTPRVRPENWEFRITTESGQVHAWDWTAFQALPAEDITVDLHCVTKWSKLDTPWRGVSLDILMAGVTTIAGYALARSVGGYTTNMPLQDLLGGRAWIAFRYAGRDLAPEHGGPARTLILDVPGWPGHLPGQHVDVRLTAEDGYSTERSYSIASAPDGTRLELTVQRLADGEVPPYLTEVFGLGYPLEVRGPIGGYFAWRPAPAPPVLLIGGGSGVVPLMSMLRTRIATATAAPMRLVYSTRSPATLLYAEELSRLAGQDPNLTVDIIYTRSAPPGWTGRVGRLDAAWLRTLTGPRAASSRCYVCGPTGFVEHVADLLTSQGLADWQIRTERFGPGGGT